MTSRLLQNGLLLAACLVVVLLTATGFYPTDVFAARPNVLLIVSEDNGPELGCYGDRHARTPSLDRLASEGVRFNRAFVTQAGCSQSRASVLTGLYPHQHGQIGLATWNFCMYRLDTPNVVRSLKQAGYRTGIIGKLHVNPEEAFPFDMHEIPSANFARENLADYAKYAEAYFEADDLPFFLSVNYPEAHSPWLKQVDGLPKEPLGPGDVKALAYFGVDPPPLREAVADYYNCLGRLDSLVGDLLASLQRSGKADNTLVIYLGDHGADFLRGKRTSYEGGIRVPLIIRWPKRAKSGQVRQELVSTIDLMPTLLEVAHAEPVGGLPGSSLVPLLLDEPADWRQYLYTEYHTHAAAEAKRGIAMKPGVIFSTSLLATLVVAPAAGASGLSDRPNVLMIIADDLNDWVGCLGGHPDVNTPNIDRLARRGLLFTNAHCAAPVCNPSRVATLTGRRPSSTGIYNNAPVWHELMPGVATIPQHFKGSGYYTAGGGKVYHHPPGFNRRSDWNECFDQVFTGHYQARLAAGEDVSNFTWSDGFPLNGLPEVKALGRPPRNAREFDWGPLDKQDNEMGDGQMVVWAERFLADPPRQPFFLAAGIYRPHLPWYAPRKYFDAYPPDDITPPLIKEDDLDDVPEAGRRIAEQRRGDLELVRRSGQYQRILQAYLASVTFCDVMVGRLLDALDTSPAAKNTIIVFWSDNGWHFGEKQHLHKMTLWARSTRLPLIIVAPGVTRPETRTSRPVSFVALFPTLNELCGLPQPEALEGTSLVPLLKDPTRTWQRPALVTYLRGNHAVCNERWRYIRYADGSEELYDQANDPNEWVNLADKSELAAVKAKLAKWLPKTDAPSLRGKAKRSKGKATK